MKKCQPSDDQKDIAKVLAGDRAAYTDLVDRYKYMVFILAMRMLRKREDAEEVAQDTFVKAYNGLANFNGSSKFSTWLYKIAYNQCLDHLRRERSQPEFSYGWNEERPLQSEKPDIVDKLDNDDRRKALEKVMNSLDEKDSAIITLYYLEEMNLEEIASVAEISANTAKVRLHRARKKLAVLLRNHEANITP